jgi:hypothetical protein
MLPPHSAPTSTFLIKYLITNSHNNLKVSLQCHKETTYVAILNNKKYHFFSSSLIQNQRTGRWSRSWVGGGRREEAGTSERGEKVGKCWIRVNMVQIPHTHVCKWKMVSTETIPGMGGGEGK